MGFYDRFGAPTRTAWGRVPAQDRKSPTAAQVPSHDIERSTSTDLTRPWPAG